MKNVSEYPWPQAPNMPWTVIGKGPTFQALLDCSPSGFRMGINHVVRECKVNVAIFMDIEPLCEMREYLKRNAGAIFLPESLHVGARFDGVATNALDIPVIQENEVYLFSAEGIWNSTAEAAFRVICKHSACKRIVTAGIDGGTEYHKLFASRRVGTPTDNKKQFGTFTQDAAAHNMQWLKWGQTMEAA